MDKILDEKTLYAAAEWWTRLRDPKDDVKTVEQWLEWTQADERNLAAFERVTELGDRLGTLDDITRRQWVGEFARQQPAPSRHRFPLAVAASTLLILFSGYLAWSHLEARATPQDYVSTVAQNRDITLSDGSTVALGGASKLIARFSKDERKVELGAGEAFFQVVHNTQRPFVVTAGNVSIRDVGTAFDVRRTGQYVTIAVTQGRVQIAENGGADFRVSGSGALEAVAGQLVSYNPTTSAMSVSSITPEQATAWRSDRLEFINEPLGVVIANVNRYSAREVLVANANLETLTFTGTIKTAAIDSWLDALPQIFPLRVSKGPNQVILSNKGRSQRQ